MYLVHCRGCRTEFTNDARICPRCGQLRTYVAASADGIWARVWPNSESGESCWANRGR